MLQACQYCGSTDLIKKGFQTTGKQQYYCKHCKTVQVEHTDTATLHLHCPRCQETCIVKNGFDTFGQQKYKCKYCGKVFVPGKSFSHFKNPAQLTCKCGSTSITLSGFDKGKQRYYCKVCHRKFTAKSSVSRLSTADMHAVDLYYFGMHMSIKSVASSINKTEYSVKKYIKHRRICNARRA